MTTPRRVKWRRVFGLLWIGPLFMALVASLSRALSRRTAGSTTHRLIGLRAVLVCLLIGAAANITVAWGLAVLVQRGVLDWPDAHEQLITTGHEHFYEGSADEVRVVESMAWPGGIDRWRESPNTRLRFSALGLAYVDWMALAGGGMEGTEVGVNGLSTGFPVRCLAGYSSTRLWAWAAPPGADTGVEMHWCVDTTLTADVSLAHTVILPLHPQPIGFTVNTLFYGGLLLGVITIRRKTRSRRRARSGLCTSCKYDVAGLERCPECGLEVAT